MYNLKKKNSNGKIFIGNKKFSEKNLLGKQFLSEKICKKNFYWEKILLEKYLSEKKLLGKTIFVRKKFIGKKNYQKIFLSESGGCDKCDLICICVYQIGGLCGGAHEISDIKAPLFLCGWVVGWVVCW